MFRPLPRPFSPKSAATILALLACWLTTAAAQQSASSTPTAQPPTQEQHPRRTMGIIPGYNVTSEKDRKPLRPRQKFVLFLRNASDPFQFVSAGMTAGISMASGENRGYGQGGEGFAKRFGAAMADETSSEFFGSFLFPVMLRQDPRYFRKGEGPFGSRLGHAVTRVVVTRTDSGKRTANWSYLLAALVSASISNAYYPQSERTAGKTFARAGVSLGTGAALAVGAEFWPDIARKLSRKRPAPAPGNKP